MTIQKGLLEGSTKKDMEILDKYIKGLSDFKTFDGYVLAKVDVLFKMTDKREERLLELMKKYKYTTEGKYLVQKNLVFVVLVDDKENPFKNEELKEIIAHNLKEHDEYLARVEEFKNVNEYKQEVNDDDLSINVNPFKKERFCDKFNARLISYLKELRSYENYIASPCEYGSPRTNLSLDVDFQRNLVWDLGMKQRLIYAILREDSIGSITINSFNQYSVENGQSRQELNKINEVVIDGKQRLTTIISFLNGEFPIVVDGKECYYHNIKKVFSTCLSRMSILVSQYEITDKKELIECYLELNENKIVHDKLAIEHARNILNSL